MGFFAGSLTSDLTAILIGLLVCLIAYYKWAFTYWKRKGVPVPATPAIPFGNLSGLFTGKKSFGDSFKTFYDMLKKEDHKYGGVYMLAKPVFIPTDPALIKRMLQTDFAHFVNHGTFPNERDPLSVHIFNMEDETWKDWRAKLTPTFTTGKMKMMLETLVKTTVGLKEILDTAAAEEKAIDIKDTMARFTTDVIGSVAFGIECNSLKYPDSEFRYYGKRAAEEFTVSENIKNFLQFVLPHHIFAFLRIKVVNNNVEKFFMNAVKKTIEYREKNNIYRKDFMHLLLQLRNRGKLADDENIKGEQTTESTQHLTMEEVAAQCFVFFLAGFETSSTVSTFALYEMAKNREIQETLRDEIKNVLEKYDNKITYEALAEMHYLDQIIQESLRKYPPLPSIFRVCSKDYRVPGTDLIIEKGTHVQIPLLGIQRDSEYFPDPEKFDPDRFTEENKKTRIPFTWIPFGEGPRICIGMRFGLMQAKVGLATVIMNSKFTVNRKTQEPIEYKHTGFITTAKGGIWLDVEKL